MSEKNEALEQNYSLSGHGDCLSELGEISRFAGMREDLVQAGGGNSSVKIDSRRMAIKASGVQLADVTARSGYAIVDYAMIRDWMEDDLRGKEAYGIPPQGADSLERREDPAPPSGILRDATISGGRPSIETYLHATTGRVTLHTHPAPVCALAARSGGMERLGELFPGAVLVGYATPGADLARLFLKAGRDAAGAESGAEAGAGESRVVFLKNHGLIVSGDSAGEVIRLTERVCEAAGREAGMDDSPYRRAYEIYRWFLQMEREGILSGDAFPGGSRDGAGTGDGAGACAAPPPLVVRAESRHVRDAMLSLGRLWDYQFCPDCVVYCGREAFDYDPPDREGRLARHAARCGPPVLVTAGGDVYIRAESVGKAREAEAVLALSARVAVANRDEKTDLLPGAEREFLLGWEAEGYRRKL